MIFFADKQTLEDLNIPGRHKNNSIARLFDNVVTAGGRKLMDKFFQSPLTDSAAINERSNIFRYFAAQSIQFPFTEEEFSVVENYLRSGSSGNLAATGIGIISKRVLHLLAQDRDYELLKTEVGKTIKLLNRFHDFTCQLQDQESPYQSQLVAIKAIFAHQKLLWLQDEREVNNLPLFKLIRYDHLLRSDMHQEMEKLTALIYHLDVYIGVSGTGVRNNFSYALALPAAQNTLSIQRLYHPAIENAVGNTLSLHQDNNVIFLTGANMAGKSTLMKSFGISIYLAHMGFPVAADHMVFSVKDGMYTSINVPDNLGMGYSHFYAEVLRVKKVAEEVADSKNLVAIFDELFKGTNVKDAYDATLAITEAFSENRNCFFVISTHIIEVGEDLMQRCDNFRFAYLPTVMEGNIPRYTYQLEEGITTDRQGMLIIENEGILEILKGDL